MRTGEQTLEELGQEILDLRTRLNEAEHTLEAIRAGEVDAFVIYKASAEQVVLLEGADSPYRLLMEEMEQGACLMTPDGRVLYCNQHLASLLQTTRKEIVGGRLQSWLPAAERARFNTLLSQALLGTVRDEFTFAAAERLELPARLVCSLMAHDELPILSAMVTDLTDQKHMQAQLADSAQQLRRLATRLQAAQEEERTRIAREIHDELGGALTGLKMDLAQLGRRIPNADDDLRGRLAALIQSVDSMVSMLRRIATDLRPAILDDFGLVAAIQWQLADFQTHSGIDYELVSPDDYIPLSREKSTAIFRIFQEALTNVARHAEASRVTVHLEHLADSLRLLVRDNGRGISEQELEGKHSLGLLGMRERIQLLAGEFNIYATPGQGTTIQVDIPTDQPELKAA
jgi:PAS domain S-box-containing protein